MGDFFKDIAGGIEKAQAGFLGPTYNYTKQIKTPSNLGISSRGDLGTLARDINGIVAYTEVLVSGKSKAQRKNKPLGNKFFLKTGGQCKSSDGNLHPRWIYVHNVPTGSIPFISNTTGENFPDFRGLVPGTIENLDKLNPLAIFGGFMQGANPKCRKLNLKDDAGVSNEYVADADIANLDPCIFGGRNPVSGKRKGGCSDGFRNMNDIMNEIKNMDVNKLKKNPMANIYNFGFSVLIVYLMYHFLKKTN